MQKVHETSTKLGTLVVYESKDPEFPGYHIVLKRNNRELLLAIVESEESPFFKQGGLRLTLFGEPMQDEPTDSVQIDSHRVIKCFQEIFREGEQS